jgi:methionyl-tRNA synthetase
LAVFGNVYVQRKKAWSTNDATAVAGGVEIAKALALLLLPYVPGFAGAVLRVLGFERPRWEDVDTPMGGRKLRDERVLLQRIDIAEMRAKIEGQAPAPQPAAAVAESAVTVSYEDFQRLDLRVGVVRDVQPVEGAERLWRLSVDLGTGMRTCVAGLRGSYEAEALVGRAVVVLANLEPRAIHGVRSEVMILAAQGKTTALIGPDRPVDPGCAVR